MASYTGYAREALQVRTGDDLWWTPKFTASPFSDARLTVEVEVEKGYELWYQNLYMHKPGGASGLLKGTISSAARVSFVVPDVPDATFDVHPVAYSGSIEAASTARHVKAGELYCERQFRCAAAPPATHGPSPNPNCPTYALTASQRECGHYALVCAILCPRDVCVAAQIFAERRTA